MIGAEVWYIIFEAFLQADGSTARRFDGTGLGLSISRELVKLLGCEIDLKSVLNERATFTVHLPIKQNARASWLPKAKLNAVKRRLSRTTPPAAGPLLPPVFPDDRESLTDDERVILIIEDDEKFVKILFNHCHDRGFKCVAALTGEEGILLAKL